MMKTVPMPAQESKEDDRRAARQGYKGSKMLLHPGGDEDQDHENNNKV